MTPNPRDRLLQLVKERAVIHGDITLASGQRSSFYIDCKMVLMHGESADLLGEVLYDMTKALKLDAIGGPEVGAIPMATAAALAYHRHGQPVEGFFTRKEVKQHGTQKRVEGKFQPGYRVALVEDVMTTGGSSMSAVEAIQQAGGRIEMVACILDRLQGARQRFEGMGLRFEPIFTLKDLGLA
jgi:orotate phosphoribosyltransferase